MKTGRIFSRHSGKFRSAVSLAGALAVLPLMPLLSGCGTPILDGGPEIKFLTSGAEKLDQSASLLPSASGTVWELASTRNPNLIVTASVTDKSGDDFTIEFRKEGRVLRRERYRLNARGLYLVRIQEQGRPWIQMSPAIPLLQLPASEGDTQTWEGRVDAGKGLLSATSFSRISTIDTINTQKKKYNCYRIDTLIKVRADRSEARLPSVIWQ